MWSPTEVDVDPRAAIPTGAGYLAEEWGVQVRFGTSVCGIDMPHTDTTEGRWRAERVYVCSGNDFATLYPQVFADSGLVRCKLQLMRTRVQPGGRQLGPMLCGGPTLLHYAAFDGPAATRQPAARLDAELPFERAQGHPRPAVPDRGRAADPRGPPQLRHDPHPLPGRVHQRGGAALPVGVRGPALHRGDGAVGGLLSLAAGRPHRARRHPEPGVTVVNGVGGAGMTLSFGLAEEAVG